MKNNIPDTMGIFINSYGNKLDSNRINVYNTLLDDDRKPMLVKESSKYFPAVSQIKTSVFLAFAA